MKPSRLIRRYFSLAEIAPMDKIDGRLVIDAMSMVDRDGSVIGWEVYL